MKVGGYHNQQLKTNKMKKILLITLIILSVKGFSQVDSSNVNLMINTAINQQNKTVDLQLKGIKNSYQQLQTSLNNYKSISRLKIDSVDAENLNLKNQTIKLSSELITLSDIVNSQALLADKEILLLKEMIASLTKDLESANISVTKVTESTSKNSSEILSVSESVSAKQKFGIAIIILALFLILIVYVVLTNKWKNDTKKINAKQNEIFEKQIQDSLKLSEWLLDESKENLNQSNNTEADHSFAKRVADEITRMTTNLSRMDESIKGVKQLSASARKLEQSLNSNQYELEDLLNKPYDNGMNLQATFIEDENLKEGESIITRIIKPQINYKGKLIQAAQIEVSQGL
jgi:hypothetical protein